MNGYVYFYKIVKYSFNGAPILTLSGLAVLEKPVNHPFMLDQLMLLIAEQHPAAAPVTCIDSLSYLHREKEPQS